MKHLVMAFALGLVFAVQSVAWAQKAPQRIPRPVPQNPTTPTTPGTGRYLVSYTVINREERTTHTAQHEFTEQGAAERYASQLREMKSNTIIYRDIKVTQVVVQNPQPQGQPQERPERPTSPQKPRPKPVIRPLNQNGSSGVNIQIKNFNIRIR